MPTRIFSKDAERTLWLTQQLYSDLDLSVAVSDDYADRFCACGPDAVTENTSAERQLLYEQFGHPLVLREDRSWLGDRKFGRAP